MQQHKFYSLFIDVYHKQIVVIAMLFCLIFLSLFTNGGEFTKPNLADVAIPLSTSKLLNAPGYVL